MDSVLGEDATLPVGINGSSVLISNLPDGSDIDPNFGLGGTVFPNASEETVSPTRARNMKDFENQITDLKKENFNLKLRIYFLEERIQQKFDSPNEDVYKINIELKVELESLKRELQEREHLLIKASKAVESLAEGGGSEIQRVKEDACKKIQQVEDHLTRKIFHLEEDVKAAQAEVEKAFAMVEKEKVLKISLEEKLAALKIVQQGELEEALAEEEKDRLIEDLRLTLKKKDALIQELEEAKSHMGSPDENMSSGKLRELPAAFRGEKELEIEAVQMELRNERNCFEKRILSFQEDIKEKEKEIALERKNGLKRDKTIQGLTMALKTKDKEIEELTSKIEELTTSLAKAREATHSAQIEKIKGADDFETVLLEKETLLAQLHAENRRKDTDNHKLQRTIEKLNQDIDDFQHEREKLEKELDEARRQKSHGDKTINDLRNQVEKLHGEMIEKEKSVEQRYNILLSESNQKLQSQEQVMKCLTDSVNQKDILLQRLDGKIKEKDVELEQLFNRLNHLLKAKEDLELKNEDLTEKYASQQLAVKKALSSKEKQGPEYEELIHALKKEQHIYSDLVKALKDSDSINNLQAELNNIFSLRKQLEEDVLSYQTLRKTLEDQINEIKRQEEESISFYSDQTSYLSICIGDHDRFQTEHLSLEELKQRVNELVMIVKELHSDNQDLKKTLFELSCLGTQENGSLAQSEILGSKEDEEDVTKAEDVDDDDEKNLLSRPNSVWDSEVTLDYSKPFCKNGYLRNQDASQLDLNVIGDSYSHKDKRQHGGEEMKLFPSPLNENRTLLLEPRPELMKAVSELLLEHLGMTEQELSGCDLEDKNEKALKQIIIQLRTELRRFKQVNKFLRQHVDLKSVFDGKERFYPAATAHLNKAIELSMVEVKDSVTQTMNSEGYTMKLKHEGKEDAAEEKPKYSVLNAEDQHENVRKMPEQQNVLPLPSTIHKSTKKSRLPIPLKSSRSLGSVNLNSATQETVVYLQNQIAELHGDLKECKIRNKHLQQKLSLTEALIEERPMQDKLLLNAEPSSKAVCQESKVELKDPEGDAGGKEEKEEDEDQRKSPEPEPPQLNNFDVLPSNKESHCEDFIDAASTASYSSSKNLSLQVNVNGTDLSDEFDVDDAEHLKQRIRDLKTELEGYRKFVFQLQASQQSQCSKAIITVLCGTEGAQEGRNKSKDGTNEEEMKTFSSLHQVHYVKHTKILHPLTSELTDGIVEDLKQRLEEQESELKREQNVNMNLLEEVHNLQNKLRGSSPTRYDSLVQSQARELSSQRQQIKDSHSICVIYRQHMTNLIKAFEELLQASDVDYYVAEGFREQLNQSIQLLEKLEKMFLNGKSSDTEVGKRNELIKRPSEDASVYQSLDDKPAMLPASQVLSDYEISEKSSFDSGEHKQDSEDIDKSSVVANNFSQDLLMEHLQEIRTLRRRLEESIKTNDRLRKQLEQQGGELEQGSANIFIHGSEQHNTLTSEIHFLRKQNQALNVMLAKGSRDKQKENEKLRESLSRKTVIIEHLQRDYECVKQENERLQKQVSEKEKDNRHLTHAVYSSHHELNRIQAEMKVQQRQYAENAKLLQSLRVELKVYEKLEEANRRQIEPRQDVSEECRKEQNHLLDLHELLTEIQNLRVQLERSIETNNALRNKLEEQLSKGEDTMATVSPLTTPSCPKKEWQLCPGTKVDNEPSTEDKEQCELSDHSLALLPKSEKPQVSGGDVDSSSCCSSSSAHSIPDIPRLVPGHRIWANKSGRHILGLIEDYNALRKQICEGQKLLSEMEARLQAISGLKNQETGLKVPDQAPLNGFSDSVNTAQQILEEAARLLKLLWRVSLPINGHCPVHSNQIVDMKAEITRLHKKISEQEKKLYSTARHLQLRKHQEKVIFDQLILTHEILRKARGNLELKPGGPSLGTASSCGSES
ncbi:CDK5 regulatory subunit-associated protein 2 isoform X2 [Dromiciops gliroides]|uniref:CDK5 regulatory subunit-associated protein 2 isoform X2 n=1 Tax=Dromiciops gliroides TaxID=33562 RepID=UPI001CC7A6B2|nr:CDK5 regulatory subunit-associated protein 2 isoform X2 [Dromiciops gliroides]